MSDTPRLGMPELAEAQAGKAVTHNESLRVIDALVQSVALDLGLEEAPSGSLDGDLYVVGPTTTSGDDWDGHENQFAYYSSTAWIFIVPETGWTVYSLADEVAYRYQGAAGWVPIADEHEVHAWSEEVPANSAVIHRQCMTRAVVFPADFAGSYGKAGTGSAGTAVFTIEKDGAGIGTITWTGAGATVPTFATTSGLPQSFAAGEVLTITGPADNDASLAKIAVTLVGLG